MTADGQPRAAPRARLFVAGGSPSSQRALGNWERALGNAAVEAVQLEVVDVLRAPHEALANRILATPTLIIEGPARTYRLFGTLEELGELDALVRSCVRPATEPR